MIPEGERHINKIIGENIEKYFLESDYTSFGNFSKDCGLNSNRLNEIISGKAGLTTEKLQHVAAVLEIKTIDLVEDWS